MSEPGKQLHQFTTDDYVALYEKGVLCDEKTELLNGEILDVPPIGADHANVQANLAAWLHQVLRKKTRTTGSVKYSDRDMFEPDVFVLKSDYIRQSNYFVATDLLLAIEVADTTLKRDLETQADSKLNKYAIGLVPEVWVLDIRHNKVHQYRNPVNGEYLEKRIQIGHVSMGEAHISIKDLFD